MAPRHPWQDDQKTKEVWKPWRDIPGILGAPKSEHSQGGESPDRVGDSLASSAWQSGPEEETLSWYHSGFGEARAPKMANGTRMKIMSTWPFVHGMAPLRLIDDVLLGPMGGVFWKWKSFQS